MLGDFYLYFNPRSRVGNDGKRKQAQKNIFISIHVPAWGTTGDILDNMRRLEISIHVPAWGTTIGVTTSQQMIEISIHVPAWGTTANTVQESAIKGDFNPRSRVGND